MKFVDKKNRLFGKIHLVFIIAPIVIGLAVFFVYQAVNQKPIYIIARIKGSPGNWWWVTPRPPDWLVYSVKKGDKEYNALGQPIAEIREVNIYDAGGPTKDIYMTAKLRVNYNTRTQKYRYKGEPLEIGGPISLSVGKSFFPGIIVDYYEEGKESKEKMAEKIITVRLYDRWPWHYEAIKKGEVMTDGAGKIIAEILESWKRPAEVQTADIYGQLLRTYSPLRFDIFVKMKILAKQRDKDLIFREEQFIKVGNSVWMLFPSYNFSGVEIIDLE